MSRPQKTHEVGQVVDEALGQVKLLFPPPRSDKRADDVVVTAQLPSWDGDARGKQGAIVELARKGEALVQTAVLAAATTPRAKMYELAARHRCDPCFDEEVMKEVAALVADPGIDSDDLVDLTHLPFVTIDGESTRDLDQAAYVVKDGEGWTVDYALADAAWFVRPGTALFAAALSRASSYYMPGLCVPMLPRQLSEDLISLGPKVRRRAVVFRMSLDEGGVCTKTEIFRARICSRAKLSFGRVEAFLTTGDATHLGDASVAASMRAFEQAGQARLAHGEEQDIVRYRRRETEIDLGNKETHRFVMTLADRTMVEQYNEQMSLLCNVEGARFLRDGDRAKDGVEPIYRIHPRPEPRRYDEFEATLAALCKRHRLDPAVWTWQRGKRPLSEFLAALPHEGRQARLATAIHRQAVLTNARSTFSPAPERHFGVGADVYARFSAPMREIVGVFLHKETFEKLTGDGKHTSPQDERLRRDIVIGANAAKQLQRQLTKDSNRIVLDAVFEQALARDKRHFRGTVMGLTASRAHVTLDDPPVEVKIYRKHLQQRLGESLELSRDGAAMTSSDGSAALVVGDEVDVTLIERDKRADRWVLSAERSPAP